jgi:choline dehydrogenase-like flavoprotein
MSAPAYVVPTPERPAAPPRTATMPSGATLPARERRIVAALAAAAIPAGAVLEGGGESTVRKLEQWLDGASDFQMRAMKALLWAGELASIPTTGKPFSRLPRERAIKFLEDWSESRLSLRRTLLRAILSPIKVAHFDDAKMFAHVGCPSFHAPRLAIAEPARFMQQVTDGRDASEDLELECEVVVVGTGAGGAACAYELASRGRAVLMIEEGDFHRRSALSGRTQAMIKKLYRDQGMTIALGNVGVPVFAGRAVGGSTIVNSGTCYRADDRIFEKWRSELGLTEFSSASMDPYYRRVESMLQVTRAKMDLTGGVGRVVARGAGALGMQHHPLMRNAPDCDGQGVCAFGCPSGAKRSTDVSYVPSALERGAQLVTAARVDGIDVVGGRARGVRGVLGSGRRFHVKADAVVIAGGALMTPVILKKARVCNSSAWLGKNLSIHPASKVMAVFDESIDMGSGIPQGYAVDDLAAEGIMFEGGSTPLDVTAVAVPWVGRKFTRLMEQYRHVATFGFMIEDTSRGEVRPGPRGSPLITYNMNRTDTAKMARATAVMCEIFLAAGARRVLPFLPGMQEVSSHRDVERLRAMDMRAGDFEVTAFHPLGTCRIGTDPRTSVLGPDYQAHEVSGLYVADGSAVPSALGVNPQMTIMAMALQAGEIIDSRLS